MKTYQVTMEDKSCKHVAAQCAADAIQIVLIKNPGLTVKACALRDISGNGMNFDIPSHRALSVQDIKRITPEKQPRESKSECSTYNKPAPWIQEWMDKRKRK